MSRFSLKLQSLKPSPLQIYCACCLLGNGTETTAGLIRGFQTGHFDPKLTIGAFGLLSSVVGLVSEIESARPAPDSKNHFRLGFHHLSNFVQKDTARVSALVYSPAEISWIGEAFKQQSPHLMGVVLLGGIGTVAMLLPKTKYPNKMKFAGSVFVVSSAMVLWGGIEKADPVHIAAGLLFTTGSVVAAEIKPNLKRDMLVASFSEAVTGLTTGNVRKFASGASAFVNTLKKPSQKPVLVT